ncbi:hypothetical protein FRB97_009509 [Tulasnella sp. 331]|nr:hypothetical protein FRB97_009509 [Tulasnella sp. 331]
MIRLVSRANVIPRQLQKRIHDRHTRLTLTGLSAREITTDAASHAIEKHHLRRAIEILEQGRGLMFNQLGNSQTPLDDLEAVTEELGDRFRELNAAMEQSTLSHEAEPKGKPVSCQKSSKA